MFDFIIRAHLCGCARIFDLAFSVRIRYNSLVPPNRGVAQLVARLLWEHVRTAAKTEYRGVAQLVARLLWEQDAGSSSLPTPTKKPPI